MAQFPPHASYRASGLPWLKTVPTHWQETRLKHQAKIQTGITLGKVYDTDLETRPYLRVANVQSGFLNLKHVKTIEVPRSEAVRFELRPNDVVLTEGGDIDKLGRGAIWTGEIEGCIHQNHIFAVRPNLSTLTPKFLTYVLESPHGRAYFQLTAKQTTNLAATNRSTLGRFPLFLPPRPEQDQIVAYLRAQDAHIARYIKTKRELIALLTEQKLRIIDQAVTRGLDASVKLKPSGVEWLGNVPEGWAVIPLKQLVKPRISDGPHESPIFVDDGVPFVSAEAVFNGRINLEKRRANISREDHERYCKKVRPQRNDIFIVKSGSTTGKCCIVDFNEEFSIWSPLALVRANQKANAQFLFFTLCSSYFQKQVQEKWSFGTQPNIGMGVLENLRVATPTISEQAEISKLISNECKPLDEAVAKAEDEIKLIREYRDRLIADVVTGQIDVRGWRPGPDDVVNDEDLAALGDDEEIEPAEEDSDGAD